VILPLETLPPGDPSGGVVYLRIVLSPEEASLHGYFLTCVFYGDGLLAPRPTPKLEDHPSSAVCGCLLNLCTATLHIGGRSSIRIPEDAPCRGDRDPHSWTESLLVKKIRPMATEGEILKQKLKVK
jgi:hypothetical protein